MAKKKKSPIGLLFVVAVAAFASWTYFAQYKGKESQQKEKEKAEALVPFSNAEITGIFLEGKFELKKQDGQWRLMSPITDLADPIAVESYLSSLSTEKSKAIVVGDGVDGIENATIDWKTYGLEATKPTLTLIAGEKKRAIQIGTVKAYDGSLYARIDNANAVVLLSAAVTSSMEKTDREMRDKRFFPRTAEAKSPTIQSVEVVNSTGGGFKLEKKGDAWVVAGDGNAWPLDQAKVQTFVDSAVGLRGADIWAEDKTEKRIMASRKLDRPALIVRLKPEVGEVLEVKLAPMEKDQNLTAGVGSARSLILAVYKAQAEDLSRPLEALQDMKKPFRFKLPEVLGELTSVEFEARDLFLPVAVNKGKEGWVIDPVDVKAKTAHLKIEALEGMLKALSELAAEKILPPARKSPGLGGVEPIRMKFIGKEKKVIAEWTFIPRDLKPGSKTARYEVISSFAHGRRVEITREAFDGLGLTKILEPQLGGSQPKPPAAPGDAGSTTLESAKKPM